MKWEIRAKTSICGQVSVAVSISGGGKKTKDPQNEASSKRGTRREKKQEKLLGRGERSKGLSEKKERGTLAKDKELAINCSQLSTLDIFY